MIRPASFLICALLAAGCAVAREPAAKPIPYMTMLREAEAAVAQAPAAPAEADASRRTRETVVQSTVRMNALQDLAIERSYVGDFDGAEEAFDEAFGGTPDEAGREQGDLSARDILAKYLVDDALQTIVRETRGRQVVILNEAHHVPRHRAFALLVARELRKQGFDYLAIETLADDIPALMRRGYAVESSGGYTKEPYFGDFVRQGIALGYQLVAYDYRGDAAKFSDLERSIGAREEAQVQNIVGRILEKHPSARVLVYVGWQHAIKRAFDIGGDHSIEWMALRLRTRTGIDPYCIDQGNALQTAKPVVSALEQRLADPSGAQEVVLRDPSNEHRYWPADPSVDLFVLHRGDVTIGGNPLWTGLDSGRRAVEVPAELLPRKGRRLIQAFAAGESVDAVPLAQRLVIAGESDHLNLMLPPGRYRFAFQE